MIKRTPHQSRREFLMTLPPAAAVGLIAPLSGQTASSSQTNSAELGCVKDVNGVNFSDPDEEVTFTNVSHLRQDYEALREFNLATENEPAFHFHPARQNRRNGISAKPNQPLRLWTPLPQDIASASADLVFLPVTILARLIEARRLSSTELTKSYLRRLKRYDSILECLITLTEDIALAQAAEADREIRNGKYRGPLHGIPWGVKDLFSTKGIRTTWGAKPFEDQMIDEDSTAIVRLREAGAVLVGKLTTGELGGNDLWFGGKTKNPWNPVLGSGGSSAGPASATAASLVGFSLGTDTGGSIIQPAENCGVVGLRPTYGRISRHGVMPLRWTMDKVGPICRGVEDCAIVFDALYGPDGRDETVADLPFDWNQKTSLSALRVAYIAQDFHDIPSSEDGNTKGDWPNHKKLLASALELLQELGIQAEAISLPELPLEATWRVLSAETGAVFDNFLRDGRIQGLRGTGSRERASQLRASRFIPAIEYIQAQRVRSIFSCEIEKILKSFDAVLSAPSGDMLRITSMTGHPSVVLNAGFVNGLPRGMMISGHLYDEATILHLALAYEQATSWHTMHPTLD